jgi:tetratricopeptide (TPR) repeat protein
VAIELDKKYSLAYTNRGITYLNQEKLEQAIEDFKKSLELNPNDSNATNLLKQSQDKLNFKKK